MQANVSALHGRVSAGAQPRIEGRRPAWLPGSKRSSVGGLHTEEIGDRGPSLVFLHGIAGTARYWMRRVWPLSVDHRLIAVDLLGFGESPKPWTRYTVDRHVQELHDTIRDKGPVTLVGHSYGAIVAIAYAAAHPAKVCGLVLISLPLFADESTARLHFAARPAPERWVFRNLLFASLTCMATRRLLRRWLPRVLPNMPREVVEDLVAHTWRSFTSTMWEGVYRFDVRAEIERLSTELSVLCVHGEVDDTAPIESVQALQRSLPSWSLTPLPGVDHHPLLRDAERCRRLIRRFVTTQAR